MYKFEQKLTDITRTIVIVMPHTPRIPLKECSCEGDEARNKIVKFAFTTVAGICLRIGLPDVTEMLRALYEAISTNPEEKDLGI